MALTIKGIPDARAVLGESIEVKLFALIPGTSDYTTGGYVITAAALTMGHVFGMVVMGVNATGLGYIPQVIVAQTSAPLASLTSLKFAVLQSAGFTPAGTNSAPTINIAGGVGTTVAIGIGTDADNAALSKTAATSRTGITGVQAPVFTGTAVAAGKASEVPNGTNLTGVVWTVAVWGY